MAQDNGGPAFPLPAGAYTAGFVGMSLRDWLAGQALAGFIAQSPANVRVTSETPRHLAVTSYAVADAMLAERAERSA